MGRRSTAEDFWKRVARAGEDDCWPWQGAANEREYGRVRYHGKEWKAHRLAWKLTFGDPGDLDVCHTCDNPPCCNPRHLFLGTAQDNADDMVSKGRHPRNRSGYLPSGDGHHSRLRPEVVARGERNGAAVLTEADVREIRRRRAAGETLRSIARGFAVARGTITFIVRRKTWRHVT